MIKDISFKSQRTGAGWRIEATATMDWERIEAVERWARHEAEAGRLFTITNLDPNDSGSGVVVAQRINYKPSA